MKTFIIDDDELFTSSLSKSLGSKNMGDVYSFHSLSAALNKLDLAPEVIILDHFLQGTFGMDLIPIIRENLPRTKIIYISGQTDVSVLAQARRIGANKYVKKDKDLVENIIKEINKKEVPSRSNSEGVLFKLKSLVRKQRKAKLFIVDDDELYSVFLRYKLSKSRDFEIEIYKDGSSVIADTDKMPELLILDYKLLKMTGEVVLQEFKKKSPQTRVIILSSQEDIDIALNLFDQGIDDYVVKNKSWEENLLYAIDKFSHHRITAKVNYV